MVVIATSKFFAGFFFCGLQPKFFFLAWLSSVSVVIAEKIISV